MTIQAGDSTQRDKTEYLPQSLVMWSMGFTESIRGDVPFQEISKNDAFQTDSFGTVTSGSSRNSTLSVEGQIPPSFYQIRYEPVNMARTKQFVYARQSTRDTSTELPRVFREYVSQLITDDEYQWGDTQDRSQPYRVRIDELIGFGLQEGIELNKASELDFWSYMTTMRHTRAAGVVLTDDGNLRAVWDDGDESRLAIEFLGGRQGEFVIFRRRSEQAPVSRVAGTDTFEGIQAQIRSFDLDFLVNK